MGIMAPVDEIGPATVVSQVHRFSVSGMTAQKGVMATGRVKKTKACALTAALVCKQSASGDIFYWSRIEKATQITSAFSLELHLFSGTFSLHLGL